MATKRNLDRADIGAWVIKSLEYFNLEAQMAAGDVPEIGGWLLRTGSTLLPKVTGLAIRITGPNRGVCAAGLVAGMPYVTQGGTRFWTDLEEKSKVRPDLPIKVYPGPSGSTQQELLVDPRFRDAEVVRARQMSNPSYLRTSDECQVLIQSHGPERHTVRLLGAMKAGVSGGGLEVIHRRR